MMDMKGGYHNRRDLHKSYARFFDRIDAEMGDEVESGEPLGVMPVKVGAKPELYFEWRRNSEPVDPAGRL